MGVIRSTYDPPRVDFGPPRFDFCIYQISLGFEGQFFAFANHFRPLKVNIGICEYISMLVLDLYIRVNFGLLRFNFLPIYVYFW